MRLMRSSIRPRGPSARGCAVGAACVIRVCCTVFYTVRRFRRFLIPRNLRAVNTPSIFQWISGCTNTIFRFMFYSRSIKLYRIVLQDGVVLWARSKHIHSVGQFDVDNLRNFRESWKLAPITANDRLRKLGEFALGVEGLERFVGGEPLRRIHECAFGVLARERTG